MLELDTGRKKKSIITILIILGGRTNNRIVLQGIKKGLGKEICTFLWARFGKETSTQS